MMYKEVIAEKLKEIRLSKKITQEQLAAASCISRSAISYYENGRGVDIDTLNSLCKGLNIDMFYFLDECKRTIAKKSNIV